MGPYLHFIGTILGPEQSARDQPLVYIDAANP